MGVYIPKMEMPKSCKCCRFEYDDMYCLVCERSTMFNKRRDDCPLIEVKEPHGRLVDMNGINELMNRYNYKDFKHIDYYTPTIIEREGE